MAGELNIQDENFANELESQPLPMAFIDFEAFNPSIPGVIPGTMPTDIIPCQWSSHTIFQHGLDAADGMRHGEFLWTGDRGWNPIYAFVQSLFDETADCATIAIYTNYEITCMKTCVRLAEHDMAAWKVNEMLAGYRTYDEEGEEVELASAYGILTDFLNDDEFDYPVIFPNGDEGLLSDIEQVIENWYNNEPLPYDYLVVDAYGDKIPLMDIAPYISDWCESMMSRFYDECRGPIGGSGGVTMWVQSPELHHSNSIKYVLPAALKEYSRSQELLVSQGLPPDGYEGLRNEGVIARGDECTTLYLKALDRPERSGVSFAEPGAAPFDSSIEAQCLRYCCLDTLSMVIIYLAVIEATERWADEAYNEFAEFAKFEDDSLLHFVVFDADNQEFYKGCDVDMLSPYPYDYELEVFPEADLLNMPIREQYGAICPKCRRLRNIS